MALMGQRERERPELALSATWGLSKKMALHKPGRESSSEPDPTNILISKLPPLAWERWIPIVSAAQSVVHYHSRPSWLCTLPQLFASSQGLEHCRGTDESVLVMWMGAGNKREVSWVTGVTLWIHPVSTPLWMPSQLRHFYVKEK